jgi:hypothetical protein
MPTINGIVPILSGLLISDLLTSCKLNNRTNKIY